MGAQRRNPSPDAPHSGTTSPTCALAVPGVLAGCPSFGDWLDNLQCELVAASSRADAAAITHSAELHERVQWLARVFVRLLVERVQISIKPGLPHWAVNPPEDEDGTLV